MFNGLPTKNKLFNVKVTNEINAAFAQLRQISNNFHVADLEPQYPISNIQITGVTTSLKGTEIEPDGDTQEYAEKTAKVKVYSSNAYNIGFESWVQCLFSFDDDIRFETQTQIATLSISTPNVVYFNALPLDGTITQMKGYIQNNKVYIIGTAYKEKEYVIHCSFCRGS